ncbi:hypothetical protein QR680_013079 [Steinernema hermaphroditum]|uniref:Uncharacterized protein n=1 Tax=Steinernema hermaphroditum TaxID=289476 RepID=A0AA39M1N6_9BILA|nr:hypothetical protein QR680_013079 [Steinernema hermaphroditum]
MTTTPSSVRKRRRASSTPTITVLAQLQEVKVETVHSSNTAAVGLVILGVIGFAVYVVFFKNRTAKPSRFSNAIVPPPQPARPEELAPATRIGQAQPPPPEVPQRGWSRQPLQAVPPSGDPFNAWEMEETSTARTNGGAAPPASAVPAIPPRGVPAVAPNPRLQNYLDDYEDDF